MNLYRIYRGSEERPPSEERLRAGPLDMVFQPDSANLRYLRLGKREVLRGIYAAVRDRNWGTVAPRITIVERRVDPDGFGIVFDAACAGGEIDFLWRGTLTGSPDGTVVYTMDGVARSDFLRNRIGICVLHPARECAGAAAAVEHTDGSEEKGSFPGLISADQPFLEMRAISHEVAGGVRAEVRFEGDVFEMEDQRNWTDASFKTYSTPLRIPFPVEVRKGDRVRQSVTLRLHGVGVERVEVRGPLEPPPAERAVTLRLGAVRGKLPRIGIGCRDEIDLRDGKAIRSLVQLGLSHVAIDMHLSHGGWETSFARPWALAKHLGCGVELSLFVDSTSGVDLEALRTAFEVEPMHIHRVLVFDEKVEGGASSPPASFTDHASPWTTEAALRLVRERLGPVLKDIPVGGGTQAYFAELNRGRPGGLDVVAWSMNPQVHAFDEASMVETFEGQAATVESARAFAGGAPLAVTPITLRPRFNPDATAPAAPPGPGELPEDVDPRQASLFGAAWTLGSIASLSLAGASSLTYYDAMGWRGVVERKDGSPLPEKFLSLPGGVFPLYHVLADALECAGGDVVELSTSEPLLAGGLGIWKDGVLRILAANLSYELLRMTIDLSAWDTADDGIVKFLHVANAQDALRDPESFRASNGEVRRLRGTAFDLQLGAFDVLRIDIEAQPR